MKHAKKPVRRRTSMTPSEYQAHDESFRLIMARFDGVDKDNKDIKTALDKHVQDDAKVHTVVTKHSAYWSLLMWIGGPLLLGVIAWFQGIFPR